MAKTGNFGFGSPKFSIPSADEAKYLSFSIQLGGQAKLVTTDYATFRNKGGINDSTMAYSVGATISLFPFNAGVEPLPVACVLKSIIVTGIVEETGVTAIDVAVVKLVFANGDTSYSSISTSHTESVTGITSGRRFNSSSSVTETAASTFNAGDTISIAVRKPSGTGTQYANGLSVILTFEES